MKPVFRGLLAMMLFGNQAPLALGDVDIDHLAESKLGWIDSDEDVALVKQYAKTGKPLLIQSADNCQSEFPDAIGAGVFHFCVALADVPADVEETISSMQASRFDNVSDYDHRVTRYVVARHDGSILTTFERHGAEALAALIDIDQNFYKDIQLSHPAVGSFAWLSALRGLWVGETMIDDSPLFLHAASLSSGDFQQVSFGPDEISLYPGGGYNIRFTFYINDQYIIYAKSEGWNS